MAGPGHARLRRGGVSAEVHTVDHDHDMHLENATKPSFSKTARERQRLHEYLEKNVSSYSGEAWVIECSLWQVIDAFEPKRFHKDEVIIKQGDEGLHLYIVDRGECAVHLSKGPQTKSPQQSAGEVRLSELEREFGPQVTTLSSGNTFGELALMYGAPRAATVVGKTAECHLWALDRATFNLTLRCGQHQKLSKYEKFLKKVPQLGTFWPLEHITVDAENLSREEFAKLADAMEEQSYGDGEYIIRQGEAGETFYIVLEGEVEATRTDSGSEVSLTKFHDGECFGERALITQEPRAANIIARGDVKVGAISMEDFENLLGPCKDIMTRHMERSPMPACFG